MEATTLELSENGKQSKGIISSIEHVTPDTAAVWLGANTKNRNIKGTRVAYYARQMKQGLWQINGEPIIFSESGTLLDGQHRLRAVIESQCTVAMLVVSGVPDQSFKTIDGGASRSVADVLGIEGYDYHATLAAIASLLYRWNESENFLAKKAKYSISPAECGQYVEKYPGIKHAAKYAAKHKRKSKFIPAAVTGFLWYVFDQIDPETNNSFWGKLMTGANMSESDPVRILREKLIDVYASKKTGGDKLSREQVIGLCIKAWNLTRQGGTVKFFKLPSHDNFPKPV